MLAPHWVEYSSDSAYLYPLACMLKFCFHNGCEKLAVTTS
jgi:hypothetical protein